VNISCTYVQMRAIFSTGRVVYSLKNNGTLKSAVFVDYAPEMRFDVSDSILELTLTQEYPIAHRVEALT